MALKKSTLEAKIERFKEFSEAEAVFKDKDESIDKRIEALEYMINHKEFYYILRVINELFKKDNLDEHPIIDYAFASLNAKVKREEDFNELFKMLKSDNAYLRNSAIKFLQNYGREAKAFFEKLINDEDRDIRIFAINILGDVEFDESIEMLRYILLKEKDINVLATAIDYLGEIGSEEDIKLLEALKTEYNDPYVEFVINTAIERIKG